MCFPDEINSTGENVTKKVSLWDLWHIVGPVYLDFLGSFSLHVLLWLKYTVSHDLSHVFGDVVCWKANPIRLCQPLEAMFMPDSPTQRKTCWQHEFLCWLFSLLITKMSASSKPELSTPSSGSLHTASNDFALKINSLVTPSLNALYLTILSVIVQQFLWRKKSIFV